jgi:hypothetical protein
MHRCREIAVLNHYYDGTNAVIHQRMAGKYDNVIESEISVRRRESFLSGDYVTNTLNSKIVM